MSKLFLFCLRYFLGFVVITALGVAALVLVLKYDDANDEKAGLEQLSPHIETYTIEAAWLADRVQAQVAAYKADPAASINTDTLFMDWEKIALHHAIEANHEQMYNGVWRTLIAVKTALDNKAPFDDVMAKQRQLERALWQALGALRMSAHYRELGIVERYYVERDCEQDVAAVATQSKIYFDRTVAKACRVAN